MIAYLKYQQPPGPIKSNSADINNRLSTSRSPRVAESMQNRNPNLVNFKTKISYDIFESTRPNNGPYGDVPNSRYPVEPYYKGTLTLNDTNSVAQNKFVELAQRDYPELDFRQEDGKVNVYFSDLEQGTKYLDELLKKVVEKGIPIPRVATGRKKGGILYKLKR